MTENRSATPTTVAANNAVADLLDFEDTRAFDDAQRGFIATLDPVSYTHLTLPTIYSV